MSDESMAALSSDRIGNTFAGFILLPMLGALFGFVAYLASDDARFVNGVAFAIDGGQTAG